MKQSINVAVVVGGTRHVGSRFSQGAQAYVGRGRGGKARGAQRDAVPRREDAVSVAAREVARAVDESVVQAVRVVELDAAPLTRHEVHAADVATTTRAHGRTQLARDRASSPVDCGPRASPKGVMFLAADVAQASRLHAAH